MNALFSPDECTPHYSTIKFLNFALAASQLARDWQLRYGYRPLLLETFVEKHRFTGTCYRAANWQQVGITQGRGKLDTAGKQKIFQFCKAELHEAQLNWLLNSCNLSLVTSCNEELRWVTKKSPK